MQLPFSHTQFLDLFGRYNATFWPALGLLWLGSLLLTWRVIKDGTGMRAVLWVLVLQWAWSAVAYHLLYFRTINPAAVLFGGIFLLEAVLLWWRAARHQVPTVRVEAGWRLAGLVLVGYSFVYPAAGLLTGLHYPRMPVYGVPCPTTILTMGILLLLPRREARILGPIPLLWAAVGGSAAMTLGVRADLALPAGGIVLLAYLVTRSRAAMTSGNQPGPPPRVEHSPAST